jgi:hypothetical protein
MTGRVERRGRKTKKLLIVKFTAKPTRIEISFAVMTGM